MANCFFILHGMGELKDVQSMRDYRNIEIDKVGVKGLKYPIVLLDRAHNTQHTIAVINMYVLLPSRFKGTHMSRFIEVLNAHRESIDIRKIGLMLDEMRDKFQAEKAYIEMMFPYFIEKHAPITGIPSIMSYECKVDALCGLEGREVTLSVMVPVTSLCPCSREISDRGAHNQRCLVTVSVKLDSRMVWIEDVVGIVESSASCDIYALLKRPDEKYVTEKAYDNPMFVEDIARNVVVGMKKTLSLENFSVEVESFESIHNHNAYAFIRA